MTKFDGLTNQAVTDARALFLAGLHESAEFTDLHHIFEPYGRLVLCRVLKDAKTGKSRRVGYVNFEEADSAVAALKALNGKPGPGGVPLDIKVASPDPMFRAVETKRVFIRHVPVHVTKDDLFKAFAQFGTIDTVTIERDLSRAARREPGPWNMAYVTYLETRDAIQAVANAQRLVRFGQHELTVKPAVSEETRHLRAKYRTHEDSDHSTPESAAPSRAEAAAMPLLPAGLQYVQLPQQHQQFVPQHPALLTSGQGFFNFNAFAAQQPQAPQLMQQQQQQQQQQPMMMAPIQFNGQFGGQFNGQQQAYVLVPANQLYQPGSYSQQHATPPMPQAQQPQMMWLSPQVHDQKGLGISQAFSMSSSSGSLW